jgi:hypothetical protein
MSRPAGSPLTESVLKIHIPEEYVLKQGKKRYVFAVVLSSSVYALSKEVTKTNRFYARFHQAVHRDTYNTKIFYGLKAIDIDNPQDKPVSARLEIIVGKGKDEIIKVF